MLVEVDVLLLLELELLLELLLELPLINDIELLWLVDGKITVILFFSQAANIPIIAEHKIANLNLVFIYFLLSYGYSCKYIITFFQFKTSTIIFLLFYKKKRLQNPIIWSCSLIWFICILFVIFFFNNFFLFLVFNNCNRRYTLIII